MLSFILPWIICTNGAPVVDKISSNYKKIEFLYGKITRHYTVNGEKKRTVGKFYLKKPGKLFVKYSTPEQTIILNNKILWVYSPKDKQAIKMNYNNVSDLEKHLLGIAVLLGFNPLQGLKKDFKFEMQDTTHLVATPIYKNKVSKIIFEIDLRRNIILQTQVFDTVSKLISETTYRDWEFTEGVWFPQDIISKFYSEGKEVSEKIRFFEMFINYSVEDKQFNFIPPKGVKIINSSG